MTYVAIANQVSKEDKSLCGNDGFADGSGQR